MRKTIAERLATYGEASSSNSTRRSRKVPPYSDNKIFNLLETDKSLVFDPYVSRKLRGAILKGDKKFVRQFGSSFAKVKTWKGNSFKNDFFKIMQIAASLPRGKKKGIYMKIAAAISRKFEVAGYDLPEWLLKLTYDTDEFRKKFISKPIPKNKKRNRE